ncbi:hypothetical protein [Streptomyces sp. NPDC055709]
MNHPYFQVTVPTSNAADHDQRGWHVFTGRAATMRDALRHAREAHTAALAAYPAETDTPGEGTNGWTARALRPGWELHWPQATVRACRDLPTAFGPAAFNSRTPADAVEERDAHEPSQAPDARPPTASLRHPAGLGQVR